MTADRYRGSVKLSKPADRYEPLVQMAREMSFHSGAPAQAHFDDLFMTLRGPSRLRRTLWYVDRHRLPVLAVATGIALIGAYFII